MLTLQERPAGGAIQPKPTLAELPDTFPKGRRCVEPGCITILSRYNPGGWGPWCFRHLAQQQALLDHDQELLTRVDHLATRRAGAQRRTLQRAA